MATVVALAKGHDSIIIPSKNDSSKGAIMVIETRNEFNNGFLAIRKRVGLVKGSVEQLLSLNWKKDQQVDLKVIYKESFEPFFAGQDCKRYPENSPYAGQPVTSGGHEVYVNKIVVDIASPEQDELLLTDHLTNTPETASSAAAEKAASIKA